MTKQEFMAMSLQHKLKVYVKYSHKPDNSELETMIGIVDDCIITDMPEEDIAPLSISNYGLCLHPLSDLTNPITHKGETFVPIIELAKISMIGDEAERFEITKNKKYITVYFENKETFSFSIKFMSFYSTIGNKSQIAPYQLNLFQKLIEWHFDIAVLIEKGEAIDVNKLEENPYK